MRPRTVFPPAALDELRRACADGGRAGVVAWRCCRRRVDPQSFPEMQLALFHAELGNLDAALPHLVRAIEARNPSLVNLAVAPQWDAFTRI